MLSTPLIEALVGPVSHVMPAHPVPTLPRRCRHTSHCAWRGLWLTCRSCARSSAPSCATGAARNLHLFVCSFCQPATRCNHGPLRRLTRLRFQRCNHCLPAPNKTAHNQDSSNQHFVNQHSTARYRSRRRQIHAMRVRDARPAKPSANAAVITASTSQREIPALPDHLARMSAGSCAAITRCAAPLCRNSRTQRPPP